MPSHMHIRDAQRWPAIIITVLILQIGFGIWMARVAGNDPHHAIEPDYYARAVLWDSTMAQSRRDRALGWRASAQITRAVGTTAVVRVAVTDSIGVTVMPDSVLIEAMAIAHAGDIHTPELHASDAAYVGTIPDAGRGLWEIRVRAHRGADVFTAKLRTELP